MYSKYTVRTIFAKIIKIKKQVETEREAKQNVRNK